MAVSLTELFQQAEKSFANGRFEDALRGYVGVITAAPRFARARYRVADALLNLGDRKRAAEVYKALAWHYVRAGQPLLGLVVTKMVLALDPGYEDLLQIVAELYSSESDRVADIDPPVPAPLPPSAAAPPADDLILGSLPEWAARIASDTESIAQTPAQLPMIPLFSHLGEAAFVTVLGSLRLKRAGHGDRIITEGEVGDTFYMLADGVVSISKRIAGRETALAELHEGAVFGEMALVSNEPRTATVTALGEVALLSLSRRDLERHARALESVTLALKKFTRGRFLANLAATSPLFSRLARDERRPLLRRFQAKTVFAGDIIIEEGEPSRGLYLVLRGECEVTKQGPKGEARLATLKSGDVFGEMALLRESATTATVTAKQDGEVLFLAKQDFEPMIEAHPDAERALMEISNDRWRATRLASGAGLDTDDAKVMV